MTTIRTLLLSALVLAATITAPASAGPLHCETQTPELAPVCRAISYGVATVTVDSPCPPRSVEVYSVQRAGHTIRVCRFV